MSNSDYDIAELATWKKEIEASFWDSNAIFIAVYNLKGEIIFGNSLFKKQFNSEISKLIFNPDFESLSRMPYENQPLYKGLMTIGSLKSFNNFSLNVNVFRKNNQFLIIGEIDNNQILDENKHFSYLNIEMNNLQRELIKKTKELEIANQKLLELDKLKSIFLAGMSHELRTPLNSIIGYTGMLLMGLSGPLNEEQNKQLLKVKKNGHHLLNLINDILDISKIEADKVDLNYELVNLKSMLQQVMEIVGPMLNEKKLVLNLDISPALEIETDKQRLKQVMLNLVSNAIKFTNSGNITIKAAYKNNGWIKMSVIDTGIGIDESNINKLFHAFQQIDSQNKNPLEGTGLGLYLSKKLVTLLGGEIYVKSKLNMGSEFLIELPVNYKN